LKTRIRELLPNEKKYFLYKELSEIAQYNFDVGYLEWVYEECCQNQYSSMHEYIEKEIREKRLKYDRRIYEEDGEMGDFSEPVELDHSWW